MMVAGVGLVYDAAVGIVADSGLGSNATPSEAGHD
jgi:hypothetical protein